MSTWESGPRYHVCQASRYRPANESITTPRIQSRATSASAFSTAPGGGRDQPAAAERGRRDTAAIRTPRVSMQDQQMGRDMRRRRALREHHDHCRSSEFAEWTRYQRSKRVTCLARSRGRTTAAPTMQFANSAMRIPHSSVSVQARVHTQQFGIGQCGSGSARTGTEY
ncbi:hypothetical protein AcV5_007667 [Taiwanofungus camphoratus]|nr:hypothetical protein AcV5_007667 [Antrodia cinnamomea]